MQLGLTDKSTIAALATPSGRGGIGIVRISGPDAKSIAKIVTQKNLTPRQATYCNFFDDDHSVIDQGISLLFPAPHSFTGENVLELQGHGGPVVMDMLLSRVISLGARIAEPGEFSARAFLNDKIDLSQAEAISDLINSASQQAAKGAIRSLQGEFSNSIEDLDSRVVAMRLYIEAAIDFPEEEIDFLSDQKIQKSLSEIDSSFLSVLKSATQGALLREGINLVLAGRPNAGKSSLMNCLAGKNASIVTAIAGTTRDIVDEYIHLDGIPIRLVDTAGIHAAKDEVEKEGIRRAFDELQHTDAAIILIDLSLDKAWEKVVDQLLIEIPYNSTVKPLIVLNKMDLVDSLPTEQLYRAMPVICVSAKKGEGIESLKGLLKEILAIDFSEEGSFIARSRHIDAINRAYEHLKEGRNQLDQFQAGELLAEELRYCHESLCEITGQFTSDDLLGRIFSTFCIGK